MGKVAIITIKLECTASPDFFEPEWEDISKESQEMIEQYGLPCGGTGEISIPCMECLWSEYDWDSEPI